MTPRRYLVACLIAVAILVTSCGSAATNERVLPDTQLELLDGGSYDLRQTGEPRALNLWATWCAPCRAELPAFDDVASRVNGVDIVGINIGDSGPDAAELVDELDLSFTQILDPKATVQAALRITGMPATIFVDANGDIVQVHNGELEREELEMLLSDLFGATFTS